MQLPTLEGEVVTSIDLEYSVLIYTEGGWSIRIEGDCVLEQAGVDPVMVTDDRFSVLDDHIDSWVGQSLRALTYGGDGGLVVPCGGSRLVVPPSEDYEAWGIAAKTQQSIVSLPGGEITTWGF